MMMYIQPPGVNQAVDSVMMDGRCTMAKMGTVIWETRGQKLVRPESRSHQQGGQQRAETCERSAMFTHVCDGVAQYCAKQ